MLDPRSSIADHRWNRAIDVLVAEFDGVWSRETIERFVHESERALAATGPGGLNFLPLRAPSFARERLQALAQAEGRIEKARPEVLYVCVRNAGRSQVAAALTEDLSGGMVSVRSAGSEPGDEIHPNIVEGLAEIGVSLEREFPKPLTDEVVRAADVVVTMGCGDACPVYPGKRYEDWDVADPAGKPLEEVRTIRDDIRGRVENLIGDLMRADGR
jgi:arsenate reductase